MLDDFFKTGYTKAADGSGRLFDEKLTAADQPVTCLGMTFPNDAARRAYFTEEQRKKLRNLEFRRTTGSVASGIFVIRLKTETVSPASLGGTVPYVFFLNSNHFNNFWKA